MSLGFIAAVALQAGAQQAAPKAEVEIKLGPSPAGAVLSLEGKAANLPDGTKLHVRMIVADVKTEASFFMTAVTSERFRAVKTFQRRKLAPLPYLVTVELILGDQRRAIAELIRREWGLPSGARVVLANQRIEIGTITEQAAFRIDTIHKLLGFTKVARESIDITLKLLETPAPADRMEWKKAMTPLIQFVRPNFTRPYDLYKGTYVVIHENTAMSTLATNMSEHSTVLRMHQKGETVKAKARMVRAAAALDRLKEELESRLPKKAKKEEGAK